MSLESANVDVALTGALYASSAGSTVTPPATAIETLDTDLLDMGYVSSDGVVEHYEESTSEIQAWQGGAVVREVISSSKATFKFTLIENKADVVELYHKGSTVVSDGASGWKLDVMTPNADRRSFVLDVLDGAKHLRIFIAEGEVSERGDISYVSSDAIGYEVTITAYPVDGVVCTKFSDSTAWAVA